MARTKNPDVNSLDLAELERLHEQCNERRAELVMERRRLEGKFEGGAAVHRELRHVERQLDALEEEVLDYLPALQDARARQGAEIARAGKIDQLERDIAVLEDVLAFQDHLEKGVKKYLAGHMTPQGSLRGGRVSLDRYAAIARQVQGGPLHLNGSAYNAAGQVRVAFEAARRELEDLRKQEDAV